ncbi:unnamed protein product [Cylicostephanus goldi]|uniref:Uncharacterized protein n=1 Tax=Cylicostephanus goldi TaxID=71465 RepID=A0A3P6RF95_CYLGO|nr:unnamed protein product [Cylicostephanus goldi]
MCLYCLFVTYTRCKANLGKLCNHSVQEKNFIRTIAVKCLENEVQGTVWAYGNTTAELDVQLGKMTNDTGALWNDIEITIKYADITGNYSNENVVSRINEINDEANCLVFFSAAKNANVFGEPFKNPNFKKIVVASLQGADLSKLGGHETIIVTDYGDSNVWNIVNKIIGFTTTTSKTTMESGNQQNDI